MRTTLRAAASAAAVAALALTLAACGGSDGGTDASGAGPVVSVDATPKAATVLDTPFEKPDMILTDTHGGTYDFTERTKGRPTLLFFGYTHCPDVCPTTMSDIAIAKSKLPAAEQDRLVVVFVTTDPERDTPSGSASGWARRTSPSSVSPATSPPSRRARARSAWTWRSR